MNWFFTKNLYTPAELVLWSVVNALIAHAMYWDWVPR